LRPGRWWLGCICASLLARPALGDTPSPVVLEAVPMLGPNTPLGNGWAACLLEVTNRSTGEVEGTLELVSEITWNDDHHPVTTRAPFRVAPNSRVNVELPTHGFQNSLPRLVARALGSDGRELTSVNLPDPSLDEPLLYELEVPSRIAPFLRDVTPIAAPSGGRGKPGRLRLGVSTPQVDPASGDLLLPERPAGYAGATVVLAKSDTLAELGASRLLALGEWVLGGGSLALVVARPEDLRSAALRAFVGGEARMGAAHEDLVQVREFERPEDPSEHEPTTKPHTARTERVGPSSAVAAKLVGFEGGNLRPTVWGASASYGLGEVHLLAFDATREPAVSDPWVKLELMDLVRHVWQRQRQVALPHGRTALDTPNYAAVRRELDPNEGNRWTVAVATLLLLVYAVLAGPLNFYLAARRGRPLKALLRLPVLAAATLSAVVVLGVAAKGTDGRSRRLSLIEAGAGMSRGSITRFRGFYTSSASDLWVRATSRRSVLDLVGPNAGAQRVIFVDRDGARIGQLGARPWEALVVREDDFANLAGGVLLVDHGGLEVHNRTGRDLVGVVVKPPEAQARYWPRIAASAHVRIDSGEVLPGLVRGGRAELGAGSFSRRVSTDSAGLGAAWEAIENAAGSEAWWWPDDVPVLLGELRTGAERSFDAGFPVERDRVLIRVVGWGGRA
jgi:hypothetical protein